MILLFRPPRDAPGRGLAGSGAFPRRGKTPRSRGGKPEKQKKKRRAIARRPVLHGVEKCGDLTVALQQRQAVGHTTRKGGETDAYNITYWIVYGHDCNKTQKPPPRQVTVSGHSLEI